MPRPKGSKNKKKAIQANTDYAALIVEKQASKAELTAQVESKNEQLAVLKAELKALNGQVKSLDKEIAKLETAQVEQEAAAAEEAKKAELESVLQQLMSEGMSAQDILDKLK
mgnify:CR=1 FL=1